MAHLFRTKLDTLLRTAEGTLPLVLSSVQSLSLCDPMDYSMPGFPVHHQLPELAQTHVHRVGDAIQPFHPLSPLSSTAFNFSQHQGLFQWVSSLHQMARVLELQLQHQSFQWIFRTDLLEDGLVGSPCCPRNSQESSPAPLGMHISISSQHPLWLCFRNPKGCLLGDAKILMSWFLWFREMQSKTIVRYQLTLVWMVMTKRTINNKL